MFQQFYDKKHDWSCFTLLFPAISVGNVGQLAVDLFLNNLDLIKIGRYCGDCVVPLIGNDDGNTSDSLISALELYESIDNKIIFIQQRSPFVKGKMREFMQCFLNWLKECNFKEIVCFSSSFASERIACQYTGSQIRYLISKSYNSPESQLALLGRELEKRKDLLNEDTIYIPGGGMVRYLFEECNAHDIKLLILLIFCHEGDNIPDAVHLVKTFNSYSELITSNEHNNLQSLSFPKSWEFVWGNSN